MAANRRPAARKVSPIFLTLLIGSGSHAQLEKAAGGRSPQVLTHPREHRLQRGKPFDGDVRTLPQTAPEKRERPEREPPEVAPIPHPDTPPAVPGQLGPTAPQGPSAPAPSPSITFEGLDFANWGGGHPPDTNGDVGPNHYIETVNTSIGIYRKTDGVRLAAFTFNTFMSQGSFGNLCDTNNFGDPVVLYDTFEDRWIISDFAFQLDGSGNVVNPPGSFQCFAVSKSGDPIAGGWNFYSLNHGGALGDYPKFGIWPDGLYMSANMFAYPAGGAFQNVRVWAFNKAQMYAGAATLQALSFDAPAGEFGFLPANARLQTGTPPPGTPNYFATVGKFLNAISVWKFHVDWNSISTSTLTGPSDVLTTTSWVQFTGASGRVPTPANSIDTLSPRLMMQNQYSNISGVESLWNSHTVGAPTLSTQAAARYYQVKVTGGTVESTASQSFTYSPDSTIHRFMTSVAVDRAGNMAIGYSATNANLNPAIRYAGRLAADTANAITQTEASLVEGGGSQSGNCGGSICARWGDYSAMTLDPDGCAFWYTNEYYQTTGLDDNTRIGSFSFSTCTPATTGTLQGTVTATAGGAPISGATVALGARTTATDVNGVYQFPGLPSGTYPGLTASKPGFNSTTLQSVVVTDGGTTTQDFSLGAAPASACLTDTTQADFQLGVPTNVDLTTSPGDVVLVNAPVNAPSINQSNTTLGGFGVGINIATWGGQTFTPSVTGQLVKADINLFCNLCSGTTPDLTLSLRATSGGLPAGSDIASGTITGFSSGSSGYHTATFSSLPTLTAGTMYALVVRPTANPSAGTYALTRSGTGSVGSDVYPGGTRVSSANSGTSWSSPTTGGITTDAGFKIYLATGYSSPGTFVSSLKDSNPAAGIVPTWATLSSTANTPANTSVQIQAAASNSASGPFNFVGPDGTASTFFANGASLSQFNTNRYLKYKATLATTDSTVTPALNDVTVCLVNIDPVTSLSVNAASGAFGGTADLSATLTSRASGVSGKTLSFTLNGGAAGTGITNGSGVATVSGASLVGINSGSYSGGVAASFAGDVLYNTSSGSNALTVSKADQAISFGALADKIATDAPFTVSATGGASGNAVTFSTASTACSVSGTTVTINFAGSCAIAANQAGNTNYNAAPQVTQTFTIALAAQTITFPAITGFSWSGGSATLTASAISGLAVAYGVVSGPCVLNGSALTATAAGSCVISADQAGNNRYSTAAQVTNGVTIAKATQAISFGALADKVATDAPFTVSATGGGSGNAVIFSTASTACSVSGTTVTINGAGSCAISADQPGNANYSDAARVTQSFTIALAAQTITFPAIAAFPRSAIATLAATASSGLAISYSVLSGPCVINGATLSATAAGSCAIAADQPGNNRYAMAPRATISVTITDAVARGGGCGCSGSTPASSGDAFEIGGLVLAVLGLRRRERLSPR